METHKTVSGVQYAPPVHNVRSEPNGIARFSNRVQGLAYGGAAALVVIIGLRSIYGRNIPTWLVIGALLLEACLLLMIAAVYYLTPEDKGGAAPSTETQILSGEKEILNLLKKDVIPGENEMIRVQREMSGNQREIVSVLRHEILAGQREMYTSLREDLLNSEAESLRVLQQIESNINKIVEREIERVVQEKVQDVFTSMVRQEVHKSLESHRNKVA